MILVAHVMNTSGKFSDRLLTYGDLAKKMGISPKAAIGLGRELGIVGVYCLQNGLPALNCIVVSQQTGAPGHGVVALRTNRGATRRAIASVPIGLDIGFRAPARCAKFGRNLAEQAA